MRKLAPAVISLIVLLALPVRLHGQQEDLLEIFREGKKAYYNQDYQTSLRVALSLNSMIDDRQSYLYGQNLLLIADSYLRKNELRQAESWYRKVLEAGLSDSLPTGSIPFPYANFASRAYEGLAYVYEHESNWEESLKYVRLAQDANYLTGSPTHRLKRDVHLLEWSLYLHEKLGNYPLAVHENLTFIFERFDPSMRSEIYNRVNQRLVKLINQHYERKAFRVSLDSALGNMVVVNEDNTVTGMFRLLGQDFVMRKSKREAGQITHRSDSGKEYMIPGTERDYFERLVTGHLFHSRLSVMDASVLENREGVMYYNDQPYTGECFEFWVNGNIRTEGFYREGKLDGNLTAYYDNGNVSDRGYYSNGLQEGRWRTFYNNGSPESEGDYSAGGRTGKWTFWYQSGKPIIPIEFMEGEFAGLKMDAVSEEVLPLRKKAEIHYRDGVEDGQVTIWFENAELCRKGMYRQGKRDGTWMQWDEEGEVVQKARYRRGRVVSGESFD